MASDYELQSKSPIKVSPEDAERPWDRDTSQLIRLGKEPVLKVCTQAFIIPLLSVQAVIILFPGFSRKLMFLGLSFQADGPQRNFGFLSLLGFSCTVLVTWEGTLL